MMRVTMRLFELMPDPMDIMNPLDLQDSQQGEGPPDVAHKEKVKITRPPKASSNLEKAKRIRTLLKMKARSTSAKNDDLNNPADGHTYNIGGHVSTFLNR